MGKRVFDISNIQRQSQEGCCNFKASLGYITSSGTVKIIYNESCLRKINKKFRLDQSVADWNSWAF